MLNHRLKRLMPKMLPFLDVFSNTHATCLLVRSRFVPWLRYACRRWKRKITEVLSCKLHSLRYWMRFRQSWLERVKGQTVMMPRRRQLVQHILCVTCSLVKNTLLHGVKPRSVFLASPNRTIRAQNKMAMTPTITKVETVRPEAIKARLVRHHQMTVMARIKKVPTHRLRSMSCTRLIEIFASRWNWV